jgi:hypothetical protein
VRDKREIRRKVWESSLKHTPIDIIIIIIIITTTTHLHFFDRRPGGRKRERGRKERQGEKESER